MTDNPYAAPETIISEEKKGLTDGGLGLYAISKSKFFALYIMTFGFYRVYWHFKQWNMFKEREGLNIWPVMRGIFAIFFVHNLYKKISEASPASQWNHSGPATIYVVLLIVDRIIDRIMGNSTDNLVPLFVISLVILFITSAIDWKAQSIANTATGDPEGESNRKFSGLNILWVTLGVIFWILVLIGAFAGEALEQASY